MFVVHGAKLNDRKIGTFELFLIFLLLWSPCTTVEGGMISTNSKQIDRLAKMKEDTVYLETHKIILLIKKLLARVMI